MGITFCPNEVAVGDLATWLAAIATLAAVWVALATSRRALSEIKRARDEDRALSKVASDAVAARLSVVFHSELFLLGESLKELLRSLESQDLADNPRWMIETMKYLLPTSGLSLLRQFSDKLDVFDRETAAQLLIVISFWNFILEAPSANTLEDAPPEVLLIARDHTIVTIRNGINEIASAIFLTAPLAAKVRNNLPVFEWIITPQVPVR